MSEVVRLRRLNAAAAILAIALVAATLVLTVSVLALRNLPLVEVGIAVAIGSLALASVVEGAASALRQVRRHRFLLAQLRRAPLQRDGSTLTFADPTPMAFCAGLLRPRVFVSTGAGDHWSPAELRAVLEHERHHARSRDCVRLLLGQAVADALFYIPCARRLAQRQADLLDLSADAAAVARGGRASLAQALLAAADGVHPERVDGLLGVAPRWDVPKRSAAGGAGSLLLIAIGAGVLVDEAEMRLLLDTAPAEPVTLLLSLVPLLLGALGLLAARRLRG